MERLRSEHRDVLLRKTQVGTVKKWASEDGEGVQESISLVASQTSFLEQLAEAGEAAAAGAALPGELKEFQSLAKEVASIAAAHKAWDRLRPDVRSQFPFAILTCIYNCIGMVGCQWSLLQARRAPGQSDECLSSPQDPAGRSFVQTASHQRPQRGSFANLDFIWHVTL